MQRRTTQCERRKAGEDYTVRRRKGETTIKTNNAWKLPRGFARSNMNTYKHKENELKCGAKNNWVVGWGPTLTNRQVAKLIGQTKKMCYNRGVKVGYTVSRYKKKTPVPKGQPKASQGSKTRPPRKKTIPKKFLN